MYAVLLIVTVLMFLLGMVFAIFFKKQPALTKVGRIILVPVGPCPTDHPPTIIPITEPVPFKHLREGSGQMLVVPPAWRKSRRKSRGNKA